MRRPAMLAAVAVLALSVATPAHAAARTLSATDLRTDQLGSPLGIDDTTPELGWKLTGGRDSAQSAYQVQAGSKPGAADLWDSGKVTSATPNATYHGSALKSRQRVWWRVRLWDGHGAASGWSRGASWEMGLLAKTDWSAKWIGDDRWINRRPTPITVKLPAQDARTVRLDVTRLGLPVTEGGKPVSRLQLAEIAVTDSAHPDTDLALNAPVTASEVATYAGKWEPKFLTDGSLTTEKAPLGYTSPAYTTQDHHLWLQLDLGAAKHFDQLVLYPRTDVMTSAGKTPNFPQDFTVQADDKVVTTVKDQEPPPAYQANLPPLPLLARQFSLGKSVRSARLYITGLGIYDATVNGRPVSDAVLEPPNTDYRKRAEYADYDVTKLLRKGGNAIGVRLGNGSYNVTPTFDRYTKYVGAQGPPRLLAQLEVTLNDGTTTRVATDSSWKTDLGPTTFSQWYGGEGEDARRDQPGWDTPGADLGKWRAAVETPDPGITLSGRSAPPIVPVGTRHTVKVTQPKPGTYLFDLGENVAGWPVLRVRGGAHSAGTKVTLMPGERLGPDGLVDQGTMIAGGNRQPPVEDDYTLSGKGTETWHPRFVYHGFRYVQVTGLSSAPSISATVLRAGNDKAGSFGSSDLLLNGIHKIIDRSVQSNMYSILTDCPDREKLGWLEEDHLVQGSITRGYDVEAYYRSLLRNMAEAQTADGLVPDTAPEYAVFSGGVRDDPNWGSAIIMSAWQQYQTYGDQQSLHTYYPNMQKYLDYLSSKAKGDLLDYGLGDWATVDKTTPTGIAATFGYYRDAVTMGRIAKLIGKDDDASRYEKLASAIGDAFNAKYLKDGSYGTSQASNAFALDMGVVPAADKAKVLDHLVDSIKSAGGHLTVGEIALPSVFRVLSAAGRDDVILGIAQQVSDPSYGYQVVHGATALTEYWDGPTGYGSQNHFMLGAIDEWFSAGLAGIRQTDGSVGYEHLLIRPAVVGDLTHANATYQTPRGEVASSWTRYGKTLRLDVTVPPGAPARVEVPLLGGTAKPVPGAKSLGTQDDHAVYEVGAGHWTFTVQTATPTTQDRTQLAIEPPFGTNVPVVAGHPVSASFRVTNLEGHRVTVPVRASASDGFTAAADRRVSIPAHGSTQVKVAVKQTDPAATKGTVSLIVDDENAQAPLAVTDDVARVATMAASSTHSGSDAAWTNDGGTDPAVWLNGVGGWNDDTAGKFPDTLTATWKEPVTVGRVRVHTLGATSGLRDYDVEALVGGTWQKVATTTGNTKNMAENTFTPVAASALRLVTHDSNDHNYSRVIELEAYGS